MRNFRDIREKKDGPCWPGYKQVGTKMKNGKEVPNCVPIDEGVSTIDHTLVKGIEVILKTNLGKLKMVFKVDVSGYVHYSRPPNKSSLIYDPRKFGWKKPIKNNRDLLSFAKILIKKQPQLTKEDVKEELVEGPTDKALDKKSKASGISKSILKKVFDRGVAAWKVGHKPGTTPAQWGMARVNSFITKGKVWYKHDSDLAKQV